MLLSVMLLRVVSAAGAPLRSIQLCVKVPSAAVTCCHRHFLYLGQVAQVFWAEHIISVQSAILLTNFFKVDMAPFFFNIKFARFGVMNGLPADIGIQAKIDPSATPCRPLVGAEYSLAQPQFGAPKHVLHVLFIAHIRLDTAGPEPEPEPEPEPIA